MAFETSVLKAHHGGEFVRVPVLQYIGDKADLFNSVDPDLMSHFGLLDALKDIHVPADSPVYYMIGGVDLENGLRLVDSYQTVVEMFEMNREHSTIELYVGQLPDLFDANYQPDEVDNAEMEDKDHDENPDIGDRGHDENENDKTNNENVVNKGDGNDLYDFDFEFFLDGDDLNDGCDPVNEEEVAGEVCSKVNIPNYDEYVQLIHDEYDAYVESKENGKIVEEDNVGDDEVLHATYDSSDEEVSEEFPEFNTKKDMKSPELLVGQLFSTIDNFRAALRIKTYFPLEDSTTTHPPATKLWTTSNQTTLGPAENPVGDTSKPPTTTFDDNPTPTTTLKKTGARKKRSAAATGTWQGILEVSRTSVVKTKYTKFGDAMFSTQSSATGASSVVQTPECVIQ
ncbi:hypothetical protein ACH5RR_013212 [Cinchona calisaya]|uniref:PB1-like domain-containing protein n=1 Tax=Cinchona calisaya TaxID=153742 RepID=A0ABD2ZZD8_9GENT